MIRVACPADLDAVTELGMEALTKNQYPGLLIDRDKVRAMALDCISAPSNFCWVAEREGIVVGAVSVLVHDLMFYERKQASVVQFYCRVPGEGVNLIREFLRWARGRRAIKMICFTLELRADPRIGTMLTRLGLNSELPVYLEVR